MQFIVLDNAKYHMGQDFADAIEEVGLTQMKLPVSSSMLNPIENVWGL